MAGKRAKREKTEPTTPEAAPAPVAARPRRSVAQLGAKVGFAVVVAAGAVAGLAWVGREAGLRIVARDRYAVRVTDISCDAPPGTDRHTFLTEVRYVGHLPETVQSVDPALADRLAPAFVAHPWVAAVEGVTVPPEGGIRVALRLRVAVLAVSSDDEPGLRAVDAAGVLLPPTAPTAGLAELRPPVSSAVPEAGKPWPDPDVTRAAELATAYKATRIEKTPRGWRITRPDGKVLVVGW